jgi:hypothetical protein
VKYCSINRSVSMSISRGAGFPANACVAMFNLVGRGISCGRE